MKEIKRYNRVLDSMKLDEDGRWVDYYEVQDFIKKELAKQLILSGVGISDNDKIERPKFPENRITNNTRPFANSKNG